MNIEPFIFLGFQKFFQQRDIPMYITCLDLEGVLVPEIWIAFSEVSGIPELRRTFRLLGVKAFAIAENLNVQYTTSIRHSPWAGARKPASSRLPPNSDGMLSVSRSPLPTSTSVPTRIRTML